MTREPLDRDRATQVLCAHLGSGLVCTDVQRGPIGNGQETWFLDVEGGPADQLVLRRTAEAGPLEWTDRAAEARAMQQVASLIPVPRIHVVVDDDRELGAPWVLMDRAPGRSAMRLRGPDRGEATADLGRHLARLHAAALPDPSGRTMTEATRDEVIRWRDHYRDNRVAAVPVIDALLAWCEANVPLDDRPAMLVWGDAGAHNTLTSDGAVTAMLDWELAHHGHPVEDLASAAWIDAAAGVDADVLLEAYEDAGGDTVDRQVLDFFLALTCVTRSLMITVGAGAFVRARTSAPNLAGLGLHLPAVNLLRAAELAAWGTPAALPDDLAPALDAVAPAGVLRPTGDEIDTGIARFLRDDVLSRVTDPRTRRGLKTAVALLDTAAVRAVAEHHLSDARARRTDALLADLGLGDDLAEVAKRIEREPDLALHRPRVRAHLLTDLAAQRRLLAPLAQLYEP